MRDIVFISGQVERRCATSPRRLDFNEALLAVLVERSDVIASAIAVNLRDPSHFPGQIRSIQLSQSKLLVLVDMLLTCEAKRPIELVSKSWVESLDNSIERLCGC